MSLTYRKGSTGDGRTLGNSSTAVMSRCVKTDDRLNYYPTPLWSTRAFCEHVIDIRGKTVWEPACGEGHMVRALAEYATTVIATDVHCYGQRSLPHDFLQPFLPHAVLSVDWIISNPPFRLAEEFIVRGLDVAEIGVAMLVRTVFTEGVGRYERLFKDRPPSIIAQYAERVVMHKGRVSKDGSTATAYAWVCWYTEPAWPGTKWKVIPPCRKKLERPGDYE